MSRSPIWTALPLGWQAGQVKNLADVTLGKMLQPKARLGDVQAPYLRAANVQPDGVLARGDMKSMWFSPDELTRMSIRAGDVVVVEGGQGGFGRAAYVKESLPGVGFQNSINRLRPHPGSDGRFLAYYLLAVRANGYIHPYCNVVSMPHLTAEKLAALPAPIPAAATQTTIADYLDRETAQIDTLIAEQERLMTLLSTRRESLLLHLITGADSIGPRRPADLGWATSVPQHWRVANIRRFATMKTGHTPSRSTPEYWEKTTIPWFTLADVWQLRDGKRVFIGETASLISELGLASSAAELLPAGTVVLSRTASVGFTGLMPEPMATSQDFWNWVCGPELLPEYLMWLFRATRNFTLSLMMGSTHQTIYQPIAAGMRITVPPVAEQRAIVEQITVQVGHIDDVIEEAVKLIALSRERRSALITAAVTGELEIPEAS